MSDEDPDTDVETDDEKITCWCGATGTYDELFDDACLDDRCGGMGELHCYCGGDLCVCHFHGSTECPGCPDCEDDDDCGMGDGFDYDEQPDPYE